MIRSVLAVGSALLLVAAPAAGQDHGAHSQHAGEQDREIKALADDAVHALLVGDGAGYALAAELNHYPGPRHVLALRDALSLTPVQLEAATVIFEGMNARARVLGGRLVDRERELDRLFRERSATEQRVKELVSAIGALEAELRYVHLEAHLKTTALLSQAQIHRYARERGYVNEHGGHGQR